MPGGKGRPTFKAVLSDQQIEAAQLLSCGTTQRVVATKLGLNRQTIWNWCQKKHFRAYVTKLADNRLEMAKASLTGVYDRANSVMRKLLKSDDEKSNVEVLKIMFGSLSEFVHGSMEKRMRVMEQALGIDSDPDEEIPDEENYTSLDQEGPTPIVRNE